MISSSKHFLFIHIPKTGGNSIQNVLMPFADDELVCEAPYQDGIERFELRNGLTNTTKHSSLMEYRNSLPLSVYDGLYKFCCVRNPWERAISFYLSPHRGGVQFRRPDFIEFVKTIPPMVHYLRERPQQGLRDATANFDKIIRFESLSEEFRDVCLNLGIASPHLPHRNRSTRKTVSSYYDDESKDLVAEIFREEVDVFGYEFPID